MKEYRTERGVFYNGDCMVGMAQYPDKYFDIAIVDPPYGICADGNNSSGGAHGGRKAHAIKSWDVLPDKKYFDELYRVSENQIMWGANYYCNMLKLNTMGWIVWDKGQRIKQSDGEIAYTSFHMALRIFTKNRVELLIEGTIHPTQKPVSLYKWIVKNYVKQGQRILDTHVGSASSLIAYEDAGLEYVGYELDVDYYESAVKRIKDHKMQLTMFPAGIE